MFGRRATHNQASPGLGTGDAKIDGIPPPTPPSVDFLKRKKIYIVKNQNKERITDGQIAQE